VALTAATAGFVVVFDVAAEVEAGREEAEDDEVDGVAAANGAARSFVDATTVFVGAFAPAVASRDDCEAKVDAIKPVPAGGSAALAFPARARAPKASSSERRFGPEATSSSIGRSLSSVPFAKGALALATAAEARRSPVDTGALLRLVAGARLAFRIFDGRGRERERNVEEGEEIG